MKKTIKENLKFINENRSSYTAFAAVTIIGASAIVFCIGMAIIGGKR